MEKITPAYTIDWYIKWSASIILIASMALNSYNIYPENIITQSIGAFGWLVVGCFWNDKAIIIINLIALGILVSGVLRYYIQ